MLATVYLTTAALTASPDMGPTYGKDYSGGDYNITMWSTPKSGATGHYKASALKCEAFCAADPKWYIRTPRLLCDPAVIPAVHPAALLDQLCLDVLPARQRRRGEQGHRRPGCPRRALLPEGRRLQPRGLVQALDRPGQARGQRRRDHSHVQGQAEAATRRPLSRPGVHTPQDPPVAVLPAQGRLARHGRRSHLYIRIPSCECLKQIPDVDP